MALLISEAKPFVKFYRGHYEEQFCEFISNFCLICLFDLTSTILQL